MNNIIKILLFSFFINNSAYAECDFSKDINKLPDGNYSYSPSCHIKVGNLVRDNGLKDQQINDLTQAITLKDLAISKADQRAQLWQDTSLKLEDNITKLDRLKSSNSTLYFILGVVVTSAAVYGASRLIKP